MTQSEAGKGSKRRPGKNYATNWDVIWGQADSEKEFRMEKDVCSVCGSKIIDGICTEQVRQQQERT